MNYCCCYLIGSTKLGTDTACRSRKKEVEYMFEREEGKDGDLNQDKVKEKLF